MTGLRNLSIQSKMILLLLLVSLGSIGVVGWVGYRSGRDMMREAVRNQLDGVRVSKTNAVRAMLESLRDQVVSMSDSRMVIDGMNGFRDAVRSLEGAGAEAGAEAALEKYYLETFLPALDKNVEGQPVAEQYLPGPGVARYLQACYTAGDGGGDRSPYAAAHAKFHPMFERAVRIFGFEDIMLVDADDLRIIYSYQKTPEFGTDLAGGPYAGTLLGAKVRAMRGDRDRDDFRIVDFEPYRPALGLPMGFAVSPVFDGSRMTGFLVLQFPIDNFNRVLTGGRDWAGEGLGDTGECYLVGPDGTMRTESRFQVSDPEGFVAGLRNSEVPGGVVDQIERQGSVICALPGGEEATREALHGRGGVIETDDYRGERVLCSYGPLELDSLRWAVLAEMDLAEAEAPVRRYGRTVLAVASGMALGVTLLAVLFSGLLTRPLRQLAEGARRLGSGETGFRVRVDSGDEFGELGKVFNEMADGIGRQRAELEKQVAENRELLLNILPASAAAEWKAGEGRASREFADVSVLFAGIAGMEEFGAREGEAAALAGLGELIEAFDEAAEQNGIEKVRTIGASYLAASGLSVARPDHARRMVRFAQEMERIVAVFNREHHARLILSAGVSSGPVVGGVVGRRKFLYDLWGDTVAIARRLGDGRAGAVLVTGRVRERLGEPFRFEGPLPVAADGREVVEAWRVLG
jgi:class 3 adenylate cyclase